MKKVQYSTISTSFKGTIRLLALAAALGFFSASGSAEGSSEPRCDPTERYAPEGRVAKIGSHHFFYCHSILVRSSGSEGLVVLRNYSEAPSLDSLVPKKWREFDYRSIMRYFNNQPNFVPFAQMSEEIARTELGGYEYRVLTDEELQETKLAEFQKTKKWPSLVRFYYSGGQGLPEHTLFCIVWPFPEPLKEYSCRLMITYRPGETLYIQKEIVDDPVFRRNPFNFEKLPDLVKALHILYSGMDITDDLHSYEDVSRH